MTKNTSIFTPAQKRALDRPCFIAAENALPMFGARHKSWTEVLTIAAGYE